MTAVINSELLAAAFAEATEVVRTGTPEERAGKVLPLGPVTLLRQKIGLSQEEFSARYGIPHSTLVAWERGKEEPDAVARALLAHIAADPEGLARNVQSVDPLSVAK